MLNLFLVEAHAGGGNWVAQELYAPRLKCLAHLVQVAAAVLGDARQIFESTNGCPTNAGEFSQLF